MTARVVVMARYPVPGQCKTRLIPALGAEGAADLHRRLVEHTLSVVRSSRLPFTLWGTGAEGAAFTGWLGPLSFQSQAQGDLGARLRAAAPPYPVLFLGTDAPDLQPDYLRQAFRLLEEGKDVLGPAEDGGYWTLGLKAALPEVFMDMPWGTDQVAALTKARMAKAGRQPALLPTLADLDRPEDLKRWPGLTR
ncbi:MAG: TIGR04282 family arsenosugar biosynthesis glycosyltransferase [Parvularcula sp.]|jgi:rSAM/selenodomain-associated transferase 1|nr:TIGR04282 family arsenosugar biosynthesis glycosyltransferase [Parvularcula sp.]